MLHFFGLGKFNNFINIGNGWGRNSSYMIVMNMANQVVGFVLSHYGINNVTRVVNFSHFVAPLIYHIAVFFFMGPPISPSYYFFLVNFVFILKHGIDSSMHLKFPSMGPYILSSV